MRKDLKSEIDNDIKFDAVLALLNLLKRFTNDKNYNKIPYKYIEDLYTNIQNFLTKGTIRNFDSVDILKPLQIGDLYLTNTSNGYYRAIIEILQNEGHLPVGEVLGAIPERESGQGSGEEEDETGPRVGGQKGGNPPRIPPLENLNDVSGFNMYRTDMYAKEILNIILIIASFGDSGSKKFFELNIPESAVPIIGQRLLEIISSPGVFQGLFGVINAINENSKYYFETIDGKVKMIPLELIPDISPEFDTKMEYPRSSVCLFPHLYKLLDMYSDLYKEDIGQDMNKTMLEAIQNNILLNNNGKVITQDDFIDNVNLDIGLIVTLLNSIKGSVIGPVTLTPVEQAAQKIGQKLGTLQEELRTAEEELRTVEEELRTAEEELRTAEEELRTAEEEALKEQKK